MSIAHTRVIRYGWLVAALGAAATARGADPVAPSATRGPTPMTHFVPASAKMFVNVRKLGEVDRALHRAEAWPMWNLVSGAGSADAGDLQKAIASFLGPGSTIPVEDVLRCEIGFIADSWSGIGSAVWMARIPDENLLDKWFPRSQRAEGRQPNGLRFFRTQDGVIVAVKNGIAVMSRRSDRGTMLRDVLGLMSGSRADSLDRDTRFQNLLSYLPQRELATVYLSPKSFESRKDERAPVGLLPDFDSLAIRMYEDDGRLDFAIRGRLASPSRMEAVDLASIDQLLRLPQSTVGAASIAVDFAGAYAAAGSAAGGRLAQYVALLDGLTGGDVSAANLIQQLGPNMIVAWEPDLRSTAQSPQIALMVESKDAKLSADFADEAAGNAIKLMQVMDPREDAPPLVIHESTHLGSRIRSVPMRPFADSSPLPIARLLADCEPAWTSWGKWVIVALHREHIERILDAQAGLAPTLAISPDVQRLAKQRGDRAMFCVGRPGMAADVLDQWLAAHERGSVSLLDPGWWQPSGRRAGDTAGTLGIGMKANQRAGMVVVARVHPDSPAAGLLQPGDRIIGIDGALLPMNSPNAELRRRWHSLTQESASLRVLRGEETLDIPIKKAGTPDPWATLMMQPADAMREFAAVGHAMQFASFSVLAGDDTHYSARLSLRFASSPAPGAAVTAEAGQSK